MRPMDLDCAMTLAAPLRPLCDLRLLLLLIELGIEGGLVDADGAWLNTPLTL